MSLSNENSIYYNTRAEIFMVLKDVNTSYMLTSNGELKTSTSIKNQQITVFWRPPGALQWLEKYKTEILPGKSNLQFLASMILDFDGKDPTQIALKFEIRHQASSKKSSGLELERREEMSLWSMSYTTLDKILVTGSKGLELYLTLDFGIPETKIMVKQARKAFPGSLLIRGEIVHPSHFGVLLQFGLQSEKSTADYFIELHKLNQENVFELSHPYTLVYRSEQDETLANFLISDGKRIYFNESRLSNGDPDRVLKVDIFKKETFNRKGFALTTLGTLLKEEFQVLNVDRVDSFNPYKKKEIKVILKLCAKIPNHPIDYYFNLGWKIVPVFAIDYSRSNWNETLHKRVLHEGQTGRTPYEEALELSSEALSALACGHAVFYGFGCPSNSYMNAYRPGCQFVASAVKNYHDALCLNLMSALTLPQERCPTTNGGGAGSQSSSASSASASSAYVLHSGSGSVLSPLLSDLVALISARKCVFEYYTVVILTDGQFTDCRKYMMLLKELSLLPVSLIFIGIGFGDFGLLQQLEQAWALPFNGVFLNRRFIQLIHFRCQNHWDSALTREKYRAPKDIFTKELLTTVQEHALDYFKRCSTEYKK